jgi:hypothetical protein
MAYRSPSATRFHLFKKTAANLYQYKDNKGCYQYNADDGEYNGENGSNGGTNKFQGGYGRIPYASCKQS